MALPVILVDPPKHLSPRVLRLIMELIDALNMLEDRIAALTEEIEALAAECDACQRLMSVSGIGVIIAPSSPRSAPAALSNRAEISLPGSVWCRGSCLPAAVQSSPGSRSAATATCDIFIQAAHVILVKKPEAAQAALWPWIERAAKRMAHRNLLATALANKLTRIAAAVLA